MKKVLLSISVAVLFCFGAIAQTIEMPWNQYGGGDPVIAYQAKDASKVTTYTPQVGDVVTVTIAGTANYDISQFQVAVVDDAPPSYWKELAGFKSLGNVTAGTPFSFTVDLTITQTGSPKIVFDGKNATLAGTNGAGTSITLSLTSYTVSIFTPIAGAKILTDNGDGTKQEKFTDVLALDPAVKVGDVVRVTLKGTADVSATSFQTVIVDGTAAASYWKELSAWTAFTPAAVTANQQFTLVADIEITSAPTGTGAGSQNVVLSAVSSANLIQLSLTEFSAVIVDPNDDDVDPGTGIQDLAVTSIQPKVVNGELTVGTDASLIIVTSIDGKVLKYSASKSVNVSGLPAGAYVASVTLPSGVVVSKAFVK